jgi:hypothetical protein
MNIKSDGISRIKRNIPDALALFPKPLPSNERNKPK